MPHFRTKSSTDSLSSHLKEKKKYPPWSIEESLNLYNMPHWSKGYFSINNKGNVCVTPKGEDGPSLDLKDLVEDLKKRGIRLPLWIRFPDIVASRISQLRTCFHKAFESYKFQGNYRGVYPVKVNQQRALVQEIASLGEKMDLGLEVGSKPELLIALAELRNSDSLLICNGFKDRSYIRTAVMANRLRKHTILVIDSYMELPLIVEEAKREKVNLEIGFRVKLGTRGSGKWTEASGIRSKFGLTMTEVIDGINFLKENSMLDTLKLLHFHIGSQITSIQPIKESLSEACRIYAEIYELGVQLRYIDVGGGLGVDYDGSKTNSENSLNYSEQEYANDVVAAIRTIFDERSIPHPEIITESGRALVAHHCIMIFDVLGENNVTKGDYPKIPAKKQHKSVHEMYRLYSNIHSKNLVESYHNVNQLIENSLNLFKLGYLNLTNRAYIEELYWHSLKKIYNIIKRMGGDIPEELEPIENQIKDNYFCNFSIFQSAPDHWAVKQLFPVMPIHRLEEKPSKRITIFDLTCDSDGKMDSFIDIKEDTKSFLEAHHLEEKKEYYLGTFLLGAYQETLGDLHNLFGDTDSVHISIKDNGEYDIESYLQGDSIKQVLEYVEYDCSNLLEKVRVATESSIKKEEMSLQQGRDFLRYYEKQLNGYTYLGENE